MGKIKETATKWVDKLFPKQQSSSNKRGVGGAVAKKTDSGSFSNYFGSIIARVKLTRTFQDLTEEVINTLPDNKVRELIRRASPIVAKAIADYADAMASGWVLWADRTLGQKEDTPAQRLLDDFISLLEREQGGLEQIIAETARGMFTHGGIFWELVIDEDGRTPIGLKVLDPSTAKFQRATDPKLGEIYELGQDIPFDEPGNPRRRAPGSLVSTNPGSFSFVSFHDDPTIQYRAIQGDANDPYGTPILDPAVFHVNMMAGFFSAFKDAITGHIWPNLLITIDEEKFRNSAGDDLNAEQLQKKLDAALKNIEDNVQALKAGDALIQPDSVKMGGQVTGNNKAPLGSLKDIQDVIRRELIIAVQSQPIFMGSNEAIAETHAVEQRKAHAQLIRRGQKAINGLMTEFLNLILMLNNYPPLAEFKLTYVNTADYKDQAMTYREFRDGLLKGSEDMIKLVEALQAAVEAQFMTPEEAKETFDHELEIRRQVDILPRDL